MRKFIAVLFILSLNTAFADEPAPSVSGSESYKVSPSGNVPQEYVVPRISSTGAPLRKREPKSCREYLAICERSCKERGDMFKFQCIGQDFQPFQDHSRCQCADDMFPQVVSRNRFESLQVSKEKISEPNK
ncbi:MAG: hypothetical protein PHP53_24350 [Prolixibacteraceae bacterium]|nr:hypothetical protein [Prolixibacteraceae bacterium]